MSVNKVILVGNLTRDAEVRTVGQNQVARFGLATSNKYRNASGETVEETEFHNVELWGNAGVHRYLLKGQQVFVEGSIKTDRWQDNQGGEHSVVKVKAFTLQLLGSRPAAPQQPQQPMMQQQAPAYPPQPGYGQQAYNRPPAPPTPPVPQQTSAPWGEDDLPL